MTTTAQNQYAELVQQGQETVRAAVDSWSKAVQDVAGHLPTAQPAGDPSEVIDQVFDVAAKLLDAQREFAKNLVTSSKAATETVTQQFAKATGQADAATTGTAAE